MAKSADEGDDAKRHPRLARPTSYDVGYGKPPATSRFKAGQSGNPKGRPRGAKNRMPALHEERLKGIILQEAYRTIKVREGEKNVTVPIATAVVRAVAVNAAKGNNRAAMLFTEMVNVVENDNKRSYDEYVKTMIDYKSDWEQEIDRHKRLGVEPPDPLPHPDDIRVNFNTGEVRITGPFCKEDLRELEHFLCRRAGFEKDLEWSQKARRRAKNTNLAEILDQEINHSKRILAIIETIIDQRASPSCVQRLVARKQVVIDPIHRDPEVEARMQQRAKR